MFDTVDMLTVHRNGKKHLEGESHFDLKVWMMIFLLKLIKNKTHYNCSEFPAGLDNMASIHIFTSGNIDEYNDKYHIEWQTLDKQLNI